MIEAGLPLLVELAGARVLCVGAGPVAAAKLTRLLAAGAVIEVVAPSACQAVSDAAAKRRLTWTRRPYRTTDLRGALLVLAATADAGTNDRIAAEARAAATFCIRAGAGSDGSAALLAALHRGPLLMAVSSGGAAPALARRVRDELAERYGPEYGELATLLGELRDDPDIRDALSALSAEERRARWHAVLDTDILSLLRTGRAVTAREVATACLSWSSD